MYIEETGSQDPNAQTIVFIHGAAVSGWMWQMQVSQFSDYHVLVPDMPQHGRSADVRPFSIVDAAAAVASLIRSRAHQGRAHVVGLSLGSSIALQLMSQQPELVDHAIVSGTTVGPIPGTGFMIRFPKPLLAMAKQDFVLGQTIKALHIPPEFAAQYEQATKQMRPELFVKISRDAHEFRPPDALKAINVPTLAVAGSKETGVNLRATQMIAALMPNAQGYLAPNLGHMWNAQNPQLFNRMVRAWLTDTALPDELLPLAA